MKNLNSNPSLHRRVSYRTVDIGNKKDSAFGVRGAGDVGGKAAELFDMAGAAAGV